MVAFILPANSATGGYEINNSLRFNDDDSPRLNITPSAGNRKTWTFSCWLKRSNIGTYQRIFSASSAGDNEHLIFRETDTLHFVSGDATIDVMTNAVYKDPSAWCHIVCAVDTTDGTAANRVKLYVNGSQITSLANSTYPSADADTGYNENVAHDIGRSAVDAQYFDGYMSDVYFIDGTQYAASDFGETDDNGVWIPKEASVTFGTNGFKLEFKETGTGTASASTIGADTSGNTNHLTSTNLAATDVTTDTPTNNFATFNSLHKASNVTLSEANCKAAIAGAGQSRSVTATIAVSKGKWYWETKYTTDVVSAFFGLVSADIAWNINATDYPSSGVSDNVGFNDGGTKYVNGTSSSYGSGFGNNDIIGVAANLDDDEVVFYVNGTAQNSGTAISKTFSGTYFFVVQHQSGSGTSNFEINFGNPTFSISSGNADANGYGNFEYAPPSGYFAVCTKNLAEYG